VIKFLPQRTQRFHKGHKEDFAILLPLKTGLFSVNITDVLTHQYYHHLSKKGEKQMTIRRKSRWSFKCGRCKRPLYRKQKHRQDPPAAALVAV
jgi:uncharacterized paraquat-inducible protein A